MSLDIPVFTSGIRDGETIIGTKTSNKGTVIKIKGNYPCNISSLNQSDNITFNKLGLLPSFIDKSKEEIYKKLSFSSTQNKDLYLHEVDLMIKFVKISGHGFTKKLSEEQINFLLAGNKNDPDGYWKIRDVYNCIPPNKPGSRARRHTLIFRPSIWSLMLTCELVTSATGLIISVFDGSSCTKKEITNNDEIMYKIKYNSDVWMNEPLYILANKNRDTPLNMESMKKLLSMSEHSTCAAIDMTDFDEIRSILSWFTPAVHKSLVQKIIRTGCSIITHKSKSYDSLLVLLVSFSMLITSPGSFVPDIQRFVSGLESASKRLAVSIFEDSYTDNPDVLTSMLASALLIQNVHTWRPTDETILKWLTVALDAQKSYRMYEYRLHPFKSLTVRNYDYYTVSAMILFEIKSFKSDISMLNSIATNNGDPNLYVTKELIEKIPLVHCIDYHSLPEIAYYYNTNLMVARNNQDNKKSDNSLNELPYTELFSRLFSEVTGVNPRKDKYYEFVLNNEEVIMKYHLKYENMPFVKETRIAQKRLWDMKSSRNTDKIKLGRTNETKQIKYTLDSSWIAGLVGQLEINLGSTTAIVTIRPTDIYKLVAIKKPKRNEKTIPELTDVENENALQQCWNYLTEGITLTNVPNTLFWLKGSILRYYEKNYYIYTPPFNLYIEPQWKLWESVCQTSIDLPILESINDNCDDYEKVVKYTGIGVCKYADTKLIKLINNTDISVLRRLLVHMIGFKSKIELYKINKQGVGSEYMVAPEDTNVFAFLIKICILYPGALQIENTKRFKVIYGPLVWSIRDKIQEKIYETADIYTKWTTVGDTTGRKLWEHQTDSVERMIEKNKKGKKGHLIWIPVRFGKTLIVLTYLKYLIDNNKMPNYCVYTLPTSALTSIESEIAAFGFQYQILDMTLHCKGSKILYPNCINIVKHDHMRLNGMDQQLKKYASDMIFINDEFHMTLNQTKRTSIALEVARLSVDFIGMSGTIIQNNNIKELITWLEQIVEFEITEKNFMVAIGSMISKKLHTKVIVNRHEVNVDFTDEETDEHKSLIPPAMGGTNINPSMSQFRKAADICWNACTKKNVELTLNYIRYGERVMIVAKDINNQVELRNMLIDGGLDEKYIFVIEKDKTINLTYTDPRDYYVVITTHRYNMGYSLSKLGVMITSVYFNNQASREQLEGRINELNQGRKSIELVTLHCGILTYTLKNHENARSLSQAIKGFADIINIT